MTSTINETEVYRMLDQITELKAKLARQEQLLNSVAKSYDEKLTQAYMSGGIKESTWRIIKEWQLFAGEKAIENGLIAEQLEFTVRIAQDWKTRAEAAEKLLSAPDKVIDNMTAVISERIAAESALAAAQAQVAELKAQLAAQAWRPVAEQEPPQGQNVIGKQYIESPPCIVSLDFDPMDNEWIWQDVDGVSYHYDSINYWRPIDPPRPNPPGHPTPSNSTGLAIGE